jgi:hypothetical protein
MLPRTLYELMPWIYLATGIISGLLIDSTLILIAAMLLISAGVLTLVLRCHYRRGPGESAIASSDRRRGSDRRRRDALSFPTIDNAGNLVMHNRRRGDRRGGFSPGYA